MTPTAAPTRRVSSLAAHRARARRGAIDALRWMTLGDWHPDDDAARPDAADRWASAALAGGATSHRMRRAEARWFADHNRPHLAGMLLTELADERSTAAAAIATVTLLIDEVEVAGLDAFTMDDDASPPSSESVVDVLVAAPGAPAAAVAAASRI